MRGAHAHVRPAARPARRWACPWRTRARRASCSRVWACPRRRQRWGAPGGLSLGDLTAAYDLLAAWRAHAAVGATRAHWRSRACSGSEAGPRGGVVPSPSDPTGSSSISSLSGGED